MKSFFSSFSLRCISKLKTENLILFCASGNSKGMSSPNLNSLLWYFYAQYANLLRSINIVNLEGIGGACRSWNNLHFFQGPKLRKQD